MNEVVSKRRRAAVDATMLDMRDTALGAFGKLIEQDRMKPGAP